MGELSEKLRDLDGSDDSVRVDVSYGAIRKAHNRRMDFEDRIKALEAELAQKEVDLETNRQQCRHQIRLREKAEAERDVLDQSLTVEMKTSNQLKAELDAIKDAVLRSHPLSSDEYRESGLGDIAALRQLALGISE